MIAISCKLLQKNVIELFDNIWMKFWAKYKFY